jgi:outer membrane protein
MKRLLATALVGLLPLFAQADMLGLKIGANAWQQNYDGNVKSGPDNVSLDNDLGYDDDTNYQGYISFEHPIPIIPNILVQRTIIDTDAKGTLNNVNFDNTIYNGRVDSTIDLTHTDATLYYEVLDNWVSLDIGITGRMFEQGFEMTDVTTGEKSKIDVDSVIPLVYLAVKFDLPLTGLYVGADGNGVSFDDDQIIDIKAMVGWEIFAGLGIEAGYRYFDIDYKDGRDEVDMTIEGPYAGVFFHF